MSKLLLFTILIASIQANASVTVPEDCPTASSIHGIHVFEHDASVNSQCDQDTCRVIFVEHNMSLSNQKGVPSQWSLQMHLNADWMDVIFSVGLYEKVQNFYQKVRAPAAIETSDAAVSGKVCVYRLDAATKLIATPMQ